MSEQPTKPIDDALDAITRGDDQAAEQLLPVVYAELRELARSLMARLPEGQTLQPTALVHEAYVRLLSSRRSDWKSRAYFFGAAAKAMRQILVDQARRKASLKRGRGRQRVDVDPQLLPLDSPTVDIVALDEALERLEQVDPRRAQVVMLRYFAGLSSKETAAALDISERTVEREWLFARTLLYTMLAQPDLEL